jgi:hypothetical protein
MTKDRRELPPFEKGGPGGIFTVKVRKPCFPSFPGLTGESRNGKDFWTQAFAGVTTLMTFYELVKDVTF